MKDKSKGFILATAAATLLATGFTPTLLNADSTTVVTDTIAEDGCPNGCPNTNENGKEKVRQRENRVSNLMTDEPCFKEDEDQND